MKKKLFLIPLIVIVCLCLGLFFYKSTFSTEEYVYSFDRTKSVSISKDDIKKLILKTVYAFYDKNEYIQYRSDELSIVGEKKNYFRNLTIAPEDINKNNTVYMDNLSFIFSVYLNSIYLNLDTDIDLDTGDGLNTTSFLNYLNNGNKLVVSGSIEEHDDSSKQINFITYYGNMLEIGDVIVYKTNDDTYFFGLYLENNKYIILKGDDDNFESSPLKIKSLNDGVFNNNSFLENVTDYYIYRPLNDLSFNNNLITKDIPVNSLERIDNVFVSKYTNVNLNDVSRGQTIKYTIEISNKSDKDITVYKITDYISENVSIDNIGDKYNSNYNYNNRLVSWFNIYVTAGNSVSIDYYVTVNGIDDYGIADDSYLGKKVESVDTRIYFNSSNYFGLNKISYNIYNTFNNEQVEDLTAILERFSNEEYIFEYDNDNEYLDEYKNSDGNIHLNKYTFLNYIYYNAFGLDIINLSDTNILSSIFKYNDSYYVRNNDLSSLDETSNKINNLLEDNMYGGTLLFDSDIEKVISNVSNKKYTYDKFNLGDIIVLFNKDNDDMISNVYLYNGNFVTYDSDGYKEINNIDIYNNSLYVVLRPTKIYDINVKSAKISDVTLNLGDTKEIKYEVSPSNATIKNVTFTNQDNISMVRDFVIKGVKTGNSVLNVKFNDNCNVDINVTVLKNVYNLSVTSVYPIDNDNDIIYVDNDLKVDTIISNIKVSNDNIELKIFNDEDEEITDTISGNVSLKLILNDELVKKYDLVYITLDKGTDINKNIIYADNIIKYVDLGTKVSDMLALFKLNGYNTDVEIYSSSNQKKDNDSVLGTGDKIVFKIYGLTYEYRIAVLYDVSGNGKFNVNDIILAKRYLINWYDKINDKTYEFDDLTKAATDVTLNGKSNANDVIIMMRAIG